MGILDVTGIGPVAVLAQDVIDKIFPDKEAQAKERSDYMLKAQELDNQLAQGQLAINQAEAANNSVFVSGWRPFVGWTCGVAFAYNFVVLPFMLFWATKYGIDMKGLPALDTASLLSVLFGMLGMAGLRTTEKMGDKGHLPWQK